MVIGPVVATSWNTVPKSRWGWVAVFDVGKDNIEGDEVVMREIWDLYLAREVDENRSLVTEKVVW